MSMPRRGQLHVLREDVSGLLTHDLRTPLAAIAMNLDFAIGELGPDAPEAVLGALADCREANQRAVSLVCDMTDALRLASGAQRPAVATVDVQARLAEALRGIAAEAAARGVRLSWTAEPCLVEADADLLDRALERLLSRALQQARSAGSLDVDLRQGRIVMRVSTASQAADPPSQEAAMRALAVHFADAVMRAQGGAVWTEIDADGSLLFVVGLPA